jgi:hypothetical protein
MGSASEEWARSSGGSEGTQGTDRSAGGSLWPDLMEPGSLWPDFAGHGAGGSLWPDASKPMELAQSPDEAAAARVLEGQQVTTPLGSATKHLGEMGNWSLTPEGQESYRRATLRTRERYGSTPFDSDPAAPQPEVVPGRMEFNPYGANGHSWLMPE